MKERYKPLLTPWKIGKVEIKNRIVLTSMGGTDLFGWMEWNHFDKDGARFILEVAKNNAGLVLPGCQPVYNPMYGQWLHKNKKMYDDLAKWMPEFHKTGAKLFVQLTAGFGRSFTVSEMMEKLYNNPVLRVLSKPVMDLDKITATASPSPNRWSDKLPSREMTKEEIQEFIDSFAKSSKLLKDAGVDGVEVHAVHENNVQPAVCPHCGAAAGLYDLYGRLVPVPDAEVSEKRQKRDTQRRRGRRRLAGRGV